jgi:osmotically-inducible protein OsmY
MKSHLKIRNAALVTALAAVAATAWATNEYSYGHFDAYVAQDAAEAVAMPLEPVAPSESLTANETVVAPETSTAAPIANSNAAQPPITIEDRRLTLDERIQANVMDMLVQAPNLSGKIGVESRDAIVTLTGYTTTSGQAYRAGKYARSVDGVKYVQNDIRARIGGTY